MIKGRTENFTFKKNKKLGLLLRRYRKREQMYVVA